MRIRVLGAGWYGCHIASALLADGHQVEVHETARTIFSGASGSIPARLHLGFHYPRSRMTRAACQVHQLGFMEHYGELTAGIRSNLYAIAQDDSLVDFDQYCRTLAGEVPFIPVRADEYGLQACEGAVLTGERHIVTDKARAHFEALLGDIVKYEISPEAFSASSYDLTVDCTFAANSAAGVDRYEPCLVLLLKGPCDQAVTIMDGPFGSLYPWDQRLGLSSLSSAKWSPFRKDIGTYAEARKFLDSLHPHEVQDRGIAMIEDFARFYPRINVFQVEHHLLSIRAMPKSGADTRLIDIQRVDPNLIRVRAGKIDAVIHAGNLIREMIA
jgi:hypothetical protein